MPDTFSGSDVSLLVAAFCIQLKAFSAHESQFLIAIFAIRPRVFGLVEVYFLAKSPSSIARLSAGVLINCAKDDAAGLTIAKKISSQIRGLGQAVRIAKNTK